MKMTDLLQNVTIMAAIDGKFTQAEMELLAERAQLWNITPQQFQRILKAAVQPEADFVIPPTDGERREVVAELIQMMAADGNLADSEKKFLAAVTVGMGITTQDLNQLIDDLTAN